MLIAMAYGSTIATIALGGVVAASGALLASLGQTRRADD